jgi:hypothetical protein
VRLQPGRHPARTLEARELAKLGHAVVPDGTPGSRPDGTLRIALTPNDPQYQGSAWPYMLARFTDGWSRTMGSSSTVIAIVDTGVDPATTDLSGALLPGYNFYDNNADTSTPRATGRRSPGSPRRGRTTASASSAPAGPARSCPCA